MSLGDGEAQARTSMSGGRRGRRPRSRALVGLSLIALFGLLSMVLFTNAAERISVLAIAQEVSAGSRITDDDISAVRVSAGSGLSTAPASSQHEVVGRYARVGLVPGSLVTLDQLSDRRDIPSGKVLVALELTAGRSPPLQPGDDVLVVPPPVGVGAVAPGQGEDVIEGATVYGVDASATSSGGLLVTLAAEEETAARIARAAVRGEVSLLVAASL